VAYNARQQELEQNLSVTETVYREAINRSQLHSYAAMLFGKDPSQLTDGEVKTLERYLIWISAIAAALSSTLIAMTAVRRRKRLKKPQPEAILPDEAANYLFGPFFTAMKQAANHLVVATTDVHTKPASASEAPKATLQ
jgi:hypothetical protein